MKILVLADEPDRALWDRFDKESLTKAELILSAGDLSASYVSFLTVYTHAPIVYVAGNHDTDYLRNPPEGCICADGLLVRVNGVRILGLGGSYRYKRGPFMYTELEMCRRINRLILPIRFRKGFDILLTHAPALGQGDLPDLPHRGFRSFLMLMDRYHPKLMVHGHVHKEYTGKFVREREYNGTKIVNACGKYMVEMDFDPPIRRKSKQAEAASSGRVDEHGQSLDKG